MANKKSQRLMTVIQMVIVEEEKLTQLLRSAQENVQLQKEKGDSLKHYRQEYIANHRSQTEGQTIQAKNLANYAQFLQSLDHAIEVQARDHDSAESHFAKIREQWQQLYARKNNLLKIRDQAMQDESLQMEKKIQAAIDEFSGHPSRKGSQPFE